MYLREKFLDLIREHPILFFNIIPYLRKKYRNIIVTPRTDIVIEGYPRSANTFAVAAFETAQDKEYSVARHTHAAAQIKRAVKLGKPILVLLREPEAAVLSYVIREENVTIKLALQRYINYYSAVSKARQHVVIADFNQITTDYGSIIQALNLRFNTNFLPFMHNDENLKKVFLLTEAMEKEHADGVLSENKVGRPSKERDKLKGQLNAELQKSKYKDLLDHCEQLYTDLSNAKDTRKKALSKSK